MKFTLQGKQHNSKEKKKLREMYKTGKNRMCNIFTNCALVKIWVTCANILQKPEKDCNVSKPDKHAF